MTASFINCSSQICLTEKNTKTWFWLLAIAVLSFSLCAVSWIIFGNMDVTMRLRTSMSKTSACVVMNIVIVTICLRSGPLTDLIHSFPDSIDTNSSSHVVQVQPQLQQMNANISNLPFSSSVSEGEIKKPGFTNKSSSESKPMKISRSSTSRKLSAVCCNQSTKTCVSTFRESSNTVVFEIRGVSDQEVENPVVVPFRALEMEKEELYEKAESFIKNFRRQLRMERDDSRDGLFSL